MSKATETVGTLAKNATIALGDGAMMRRFDAGRTLFGASAVLFGIIALLWHDTATWQTLSRIWSLPFGLVIGVCLMALQIAGGLTLPLPRHARLGAALLVVVYAAFSLTCVPAIVDAPRAYETYGSFFEQFCLLCGAIAAYRVYVRAARFGLGMCAVSFTLSQIVYLQFTASLVPPWIPPGQMFWAILTTIAFGLAAIAILANLWTRIAIGCMALMLTLFGALVWIPLVMAHPRSHGNWSELALTFLIAGATWTVGSSVTDAR